MGVMQIVHSQEAGIVEHLHDFPNQLQLIFWNTEPIVERSSHLCPKVLSGLGGHIRVRF